MKNIIRLVAVFGIACVGVFSPADRRGYDWNLVCSRGGGGSAQRQNVCHTPSNDGNRDHYLPIGFMTEGNKSQSPDCVKHCKISVLCMGKARAPRWLKRKAKPCKIGKTQGNWTRRRLKVPVSMFCNILEGNTTTRKKWVSFMRNMMKDTLIRSPDKGEPDIERQENAMMTSDLCENFVAAAYLSESMPFDNQTSEFAIVEEYVKSPSKPRRAWMAMK
ncbi:uncharacterized protein [Montipora foliosa]|uniref:uncharacterized protein n=1 Tax=Montipora foliosa TaxID=591990 RepID=UPI0035F13176